ncbi:MAG TPA: type 1 glutamine amidotransferase [Solirubrobacterales bacterium]
MTASRPTLLTVQHVSWETPHRILDACDQLEVVTAQPLDGDPLPDLAEVAGAVFMGGPMNVDDVDAYPGLASERAWLAEAITRGTPVLGVCLGAQLIARALGAEVRPGEGPEIGFAPVEVHEPEDPLLGALAPETTVLHWHGDVFDLPEGAAPLASSTQTALQAFRIENAWGVLFHAEADAELVESWLAVPEMAEEARTALGPQATSILRDRARAAEPDLVRRSTPGFRAFADTVARPPDR